MIKRPQKATLSSSLHLVSKKKAKTHQLKPSFVYSTFVLIHNFVFQAYQVYKEDDGVAFRGLFIIDGKGVLRQITVNDLPVGRDVDETLRLIQAFQFTDEHGKLKIN